MLEKELQTIQTPIIFMGDLNAGCSSEEVKRVSELLKATSSDGRYYTFDTKNPRWQIDYIFTSEDMEVKDVRMPDIRFSDHFPLVADLRF